MLAMLWNVSVFLPEPVQAEAEEHWLRGVKSKVAGLENAANQFERLTKPIAAQVRVEHLPLQRLIEDYRAAAQAAKLKYKMRVCPFTRFSTKEMFSLATRYVLPFEFEQEGKGFQDAVILSSVLQHLKANPELAAILVTADAVFSKAKFADFEAEIPDARLRILDLDRALSLLWEPYWDEAVRKPYAIERENAKAAAEAATPILKEFIAAHLSESMLTAGAFEKVLKLSSVYKVSVMYVQTPLPDPAHPDRQVRIAIGVLAECTAVVQKDYSLTHALLKLPGEPPKPVEEEEKLTWLGGIEATADVVDRHFQNLTPFSLLSADELGSGKWLK